MLKTVLFTTCLFIWTSPLLSQERNHLSEQHKVKLLNKIDGKAHEYSQIAHEIWKYAELGYLEYKSSGLLQETLQKAGFDIKKGVGEIPTAFEASFGSGKPVIGILAEFDALPGVSQDAVPFRKERADCTSGHACGHHLFGTASAAAAISIKSWLEESRQSGTIKLFGTPAEEGGSGKVYMARAGVFDDTDVMLHWHPSSVNAAGASSCLAIKSAKFRFYGESSHAAGAPDRGRSALDGVEAMNDMANMLREHVPQETRIHYVITDGGKAPNVVPAKAEVYYYIRHPQMSEVKSIFERLVKCAEGAALGTGTTMDFEVTGGAFNLLPNASLATIMHNNLVYVGGVNYNEEETTFAEDIIQTYPQMKVKPQDAALVMPYSVSEFAAPYSTDVGDVSWLVPTAGLATATWVPGTMAHTWQAVAAGGMSIGHKGMMVAAKTLSLSAIEIILNPSIIEKAWDELHERRGADFMYEALLGDREAPLDYRKN